MNNKIGIIIAALALGVIVFIISEKYLPVGYQYYHIKDFEVSQSPQLMDTSHVELPNGYKLEKETEGKKNNTFEWIEITKEKYYKEMDSYSEEDWEHKIEKEFNYKAALLSLSVAFLFMYFNYRK